ncbi:DUF3048 domain-containing protein [Nocardioides ferulae]|uniref:DUF3048 domain-containing protein n=1 Tax=Nocardioides ferulae TaxID=2340821 RepID=UPI0013DE34C8|nr:DUF3048 domain-containing protein [Nocardioides ferulae]
MRRARLFATALIATSVLLAGCGGGDDEEKAPAAGEPTPATPEEPQFWPLTGLEVPTGDSAAKKHPVMVVKIDNSPSSAPQVGLGSADLVVEELVEGGTTRLATFFYSELPEVVGPVRSMRATDIGIVSPVEGSVVTSGAAGVTITRIKDAGIEFFAEGAKGFYRDDSRSAPYNLFTDLKETATLAAGKPARPGDYLPWGEAGDLPQGQPAKTIAASFGNHTTNWTFQGGSYTQVDGFAADGDEFAADTVLVLRVEVGDAGYLDPAGNSVPESKLEGKGDAMIFHDGRLVRGAWSKAGLDAPIELSTQAGPLTVPAGHTWIELVPAANGDVTFTK